MWKQNNKFSFEKLFTMVSWKKVAIKIQTQIEIPADRFFLNFFQILHNPDTFCLPLITRLHSSEITGGY